MNAIIKYSITGVRRFAWQSVHLATWLGTRLRKSLERNEHAVVSHAEDFTDQDERLSVFTEQAGDSHLHGHAVLHSISIGLAPVACAISGAVFCFHLVPKLYHYINHEPEDAQKERQLATDVLFAIPITAFGVAAFAVAGAAAALPLGAVCAAVKTIRAGYALSNTPKAKTKRRQELREEMFFNIYGCATLVACIAAPPVGVTMAVVGLSMSGTTLAFKARNAIKQHGIKTLWRNAKRGFWNIFHANRSRPTHSVQQVNSNVTNISTQRNRVAAGELHRKSKISADPNATLHHASLPLAAQHPEAIGTFAPRPQPSVQQRVSGYDADSDDDSDDDGGSEGDPDSAHISFSEED